MTSPKGENSFVENDVIGVLLCLEGPHASLGYYKNGIYVGEVAKFDQEVPNEGNSRMKERKKKRRERKKKGKKSPND